MGSIDAPSFENTPVAETRRLYEVSTRLIRSLTWDEMLQAMSVPGLSEQATISLYTVDQDDAQLPQRLRLVARREAGGQQVRVTDEPVPVEAIPFSREWLKSPERPLLVGDVAQDQRLDPESRARGDSEQLGAHISLPLSLRQRWVGLITLSWPNPQTFTDGEHRLFQMLLEQATVVVDNRLLLARTQQALKDNQQQRALLETILENLPVGVAVGSATTGLPQLANREAIALAGRSIDPKKGKDEFAEVYQIYVTGTDEIMPQHEMPVVRALTTGQTVRGEFDTVRPDGTRITLDAVATPLRDETGQITSFLTAFQDVTERKRAEQERLRIQVQDEVIRTQAAALLERSTPLIPISDRIVVMPLIGSIDTERSQQMLDTLLSGISMSGALFAILDITGVRQIDTQATNALINAAKAVRLLGVEAVLTGIRAEVAQMIVQLGIDLAGIVTRSTLQSGIAYATQRLRT